MRIRVTLVVLSAFVLAACGAGDAPALTPPAAESEAGLSGELLVFAAASLTDVFSEIATAFGEQHPDVTVTFNFGPSSGLADQIAQGAPADVFASASRTHIDEVAVGGEPAVFASNRLEIAVEPGNPLGIQGLADLARPHVTLVLAAPEVPAGRFAGEALSKAGVEATPASEEVDVRAVLQKVALGEADAGIVYTTDVRVSGDTVDGVEIPMNCNVVADYPIAALAEAPNPEAARVFVDFVLSPGGQDILARHGFGKP